LKKVLLGLTAAAVLAFSATASASSPAAYKSQVNAICAKGVAQLDAVPTPKSAAAIYPYFKQVAKLSDALLVKVSKVTPPASLAVAVSRAVTAQGKFEVALDALVAKLKTSSSPQQTALASRGGRT